VASTIRISILADAANAVRGLRNTGSQADRTGIQLTALKRRVDQLSGSNVNIDVKTKGFRQAVAEIVTANLVLDRLRKGLPDLSFGLTRVAEKLALVAAGALAATGAVLPLVGATLAIGAGLGAAAAGVGLFAAVALPTFQAVKTAVTEYNTASLAFDRAKSIKDTKAMATAQKAMASSLGALTPTQRAVALQTIAMNKAWSDLSASAAPVVLSIMSTAAGTLGKIIPKLTPAIDAMGNALKGISDKAFAGLANSVTPFVRFVTSQGVPALKTMSTNIGNLLVTVGHIATAFAPLGNVILARLTPLTVALRSINFDALAKSASTLLPLVGNLLGNLGGALGNLVKAAAPLAGPVLKGLGDIAGTLRTAFGGPEIKVFVANIGKIVPAVAPIVAVLVPAFLKFADILSGQLVALVPTLLPIIKQLADVFVNVLTGLSPLLPALLGLVGVVATFLPVLYPLITAFRDAMIPVVQAVSAALVAMRPSFGVIIAAFKSLLGPVGQVLTAIAPLVPVLVSALLPAFILVARTAGQLLTAFQPVFPVIGQIVQALSNGLGPVLATLGAALPQIVGALGQLVPPLLGVAVAVLPILLPVSQLAAALIQALLPAVLQLVPVLIQIADVFAKAIPVAIGILLPVFSTLTAFVKDPSFDVFARAIVGIVIAVKAWKVAQSAYNTVMRASAAAQGLYNAAINSTVLANARAAVSYVASKVALLASSVASGVATAAQWLLNVALDANPIGLIVIAIAALVAGLILAYKHSQTFRNIVNAAFQGVAAAFKFLWTAAVFVFDWLKNHWKVILAIVTGPVGLIVLFVTTHWTKIHDTIVNGFNAVVGFFSSIPGKFLAAGKAIMQGLVDGINAGLAWVRDKVSGLGALIPDWLKSVLGIKSPSVVMAEVGTNILTGLANGITSKVPHLKKTLTGIGNVITDGLTVAPQANLTGLTSSVTTSIQAGVSAATIGQVPVSSAGSPAALPGIVINISVAPGADPAEAGRQAVAAIEAYERRTGRRRLLAVA